MEKLLLDMLDIPALLYIRMVCVVVALIVDFAWSSQIPRGTERVTHDSNDRVASLCVDDHDTVDDERQRTIEAR
jgi:hypothetical protein